MALRNQITIFVPGKAPQKCDLDSFHKSAVRLGRSRFHGDEETANDIQVDGGAVLVSRAHCTFHREQERWYIMDDGSTNGTFLNGRRIPNDKYIKLNAGDKITVGSANLVMS